MGSPTRKRPAEGRQIPSIPTVSAVEPGLALGQSGDGRLELFAVDGHDQSLLHRWELLTDGSDQWSRWASMGIAAQPYPAVVANEDGDLEVFAVDAEGQRRDESSAPDQPGQRLVGLVQPGPAELPLRIAHLANGRWPAP